MKREHFIDNASAILILYMVFFSHLAQFYSVRESRLACFIGSTFVFFMAWFFFKSGMLYKTRTIKEEIQVLWRKMLIPYFSFASIAFLMRLVVDGFLLGKDSIVDIIRVEIVRCCFEFAPTWNGPLWFIPTLVFVRLIFRWLKSIQIPNAIIIITALFCSYISFSLTQNAEIGPGFVFHTEDYTCKLPFFLGNAPIAMLFFALGHTMKDFQYDRIVFICALVLFIVHYFFPIAFDFRTDKCSSPFIIMVLFGLSGVIVLDNVCRLLLDKQISLLTYIGENSMLFYISHYIIIQFILVIDTIDSYPFAALILFFSLFVFDRVCKIRWIKPYVGKSR